MDAETEAIVLKETDREERPEPDARLDTGTPLIVRASAGLVERERKRALVVQDVPKGSEWRLLSDEGPGIGGDDTAPEPLTYFAAAVAFCHLTQMSQFAKANRLELVSLRLEQRWTYSLAGSWRAGTRTGACTDLETRVFVDSPESPDSIRRMVETAERACFAMQALAQPVPLRTTAEHNGAAVELAAS